MKELRIIDIFFKDLNKEKQKEICEIFKTNEKDENWDIIPITEIYREVEVGNMG